MEQDNNRRNGSWLKQYTEAKEGVNYWGLWKVDNRKYPNVKILEVTEEIETGVTDFIDYIIENSKYDINYVLSVSMVEFYAILKRIDSRMTRRASEIKKLQKTVKK